MAIDNSPVAMDVDETESTGDEKNAKMTDGNNNNTAPDAEMNITEEEEARQAIDMLRGDDVTERIAAANKLDSVAKTLGEERTREELLPFLTDGVDDEDDVLAAIATSLGKLVPYVGGPSHVHVLLAPLEILLSVGKFKVNEVMRGYV